MVESNNTSITGLLLDEDASLSLAELCQVCGVHAEQMFIMVEEGLLEPHGKSPEHWRFPASSLRRVQIALRLQRDLDLNTAGVALAVDLLEEVHELRHRVVTLEYQLFNEEEK